MRVLVTGGLGFIGSHLVDALLRRGDQVVCITRRRVCTAHPMVECVSADLAEGVSLKERLSGMEPCDLIFHFAALLPKSKDSLQRSNLTTYLPTNVTATGLLLEAAESWSVRKFIFASSLPVIGKPKQLPINEGHSLDPEYPYLVSKLLAEMCCEYYRRHQGVPVSSLRITSPYGPRMNMDSVLPLFVKKAMRSEDITLHGSGSRTQNFVCVADVVKGALLSAESKESGVFNLAGSCSVSMIDLARMVIATVPESTSQLNYSGLPDPQDDYRWDVDTKRAYSSIGYLPEIDLATGLIQYVDSLRAMEGIMPLWYQSCA